MRKLAWNSFIILFGLALTACGSKGPKITVSDPWGRPSPGAASNAAFYMTIDNTGREADSLVSAETDICGKTELHESVIDEDGVMSMQHMAKIAIPADETVKLDVGGLHIMCLNRLRELDAGDRVPITLLFANFGELQIEAEIREP